MAARRAALEEISRRACFPSESIEMLDGTDGTIRTWELKTPAVTLRYSFGVSSDDYATGLTLPDVEALWIEGHKPTSFPALPNLKDVYTNALCEDCIPMAWPGVEIHIVPCSDIYTDGTSF